MLVATLLIAARSTNGISFELVDSACPNGTSMYVMPLGAAAMAILAARLERPWRIAVDGLKRARWQRLGHRSDREAITAARWPPRSGRRGRNRRITMTFCRAIPRSAR